MNDLPHGGMVDGLSITIPDSALARDVTYLLTSSASAAIANHSLRAFFFASLVAEHRGMRADVDYDPELLFCACALHDIGLTQPGDGVQRFEVDGADLAATFLAARGVSAADADTVWEAIALATSLGIAERRGPICALTRAAVAVDFGVGTEFIADDVASAIHAVYPRLNVATNLIDMIVTQSHARPEKAPLYSMSAEFSRERALPGGIAALERQEWASRWHVYD
jgi:hypothetical protein